MNPFGFSTTPLAGRNDSYAYDPIGNRTSTTHNSNTATYTANNLNQYTQRTVPGVFDVAGADSAATVTVNGASTTRQGNYFFDGYALSNSPNAVYTTLSIADGTTTTSLPAYLQGTPESMTYDADGNPTSDGRWTYTYDAENRVASMYSTSAAVSAGAPNVGYLFYYDYLGRRICKIDYSISGSTWNYIGQYRYVYNGWNLVGQFDASMNKLQTYVWGLDLSQTLQGAGGVGGLLTTYDYASSTYYLPL